VHALLGTANLLFWKGFLEGDVLWLGYLSTTAHFVLVVEGRQREMAPPIRASGHLLTMLFTLDRA
jgi:hypothetical protein